MTSMGSSPSQFCIDFRSNPDPSVLKSNTDVDNVDIRSSWSLDYTIILLDIASRGGSRSLPCERLILVVRISITKVSESLYSLMKSLPVATKSLNSKNFLRWEVENSEVRGSPRSSLSNLLLVGTDRQMIVTMLQAPFNRSSNNSIYSRISNDSFTRLSYFPYFITKLRYTI